MNGASLTEALTRAGRAFHYVLLHGPPWVATYAWRSTLESLAHRGRYGEVALVECVDGRVPGRQCVFKIEAATGSAFDAHRLATYDLHRRIRHEYVVDLLDHGVVDGLAVSTYPRLGKSLRRVMGPSGLDDDALRWKFYTQLALGLEAIARANVVHNDISSMNVLLTFGAAPDVRIIDFNLAQDARNATNPYADAWKKHDAANRRTRGRLLDRGRTLFNAGPAVDVHDLGVLFYEMAGAPSLPLDDTTPTGQLLSFILRPGLPPDASAVARAASRLAPPDAKPRPRRSPESPPRTQKAPSLREVP